MINKINEYIEEKHKTFHRSSATIKRRKEVIYSAADLRDQKIQLLEEMKKQHATVVIYRLDGNYKLIRKLLL